MHIRAGQGTSPRQACLVGLRYVSGWGRGLVSYLMALRPYVCCTTVAVGACRPVGRFLASLQGEMSGLSSCYRMVSVLTFPRPLGYF